MKIKNFRMIMIMVAVFAGFVLSVNAAETKDVQRVSGEITWIDLKLGKLLLKSDATPATEEVVEYRITDQETRVTDPTDKKLLTVADLQPGQHVTIDVINGKEEKVVQKVTTDLWTRLDYFEVYGEIDAIDAAGTLTLAGKQGIGETRESNLSYFIFDPKTVIVMQSPSVRAVELVLKPGDVVKVDFVLSDGKQVVKDITLYLPTVTHTTTTTTVTTIL